MVGGSSERGQGLGTGPLQGKGAEVDRFVKHSEETLLWLWCWLAVVGEGGIEVSEKAEPQMPGGRAEGASYDHSHQIPWDPWHALSEVQPR